MQKEKKNSTKERCKYTIVSNFPDNLGFEEAKEIICKKIARMIVNNGENRCTQV